MRCPECEYELRPSQGDCPRCSFRRAVQASPPVLGPQPPRTETSTTTAVFPTITAPVATLPVMTAPETAAPVAASEPTPRRRPFTTLLCIAAPAAVLALTVGSYLHNQATRVDPRVAEIMPVFMGYSMPCRQGDETMCMAGVTKIRALGDWGDGSTLLGYCRIANYLRTLPGGGELAWQWSEGELSTSELKSLDAAARAKHNNITHSFAIFENIELNHTPVPALTINSGRG